MINQLRIYRVPRENRVPFLDRFRDHAARIMEERYGFRIQAMWTDDATREGEEDAVRFVYLLAWTDQAEMDRRWADFMMDQEWADIKRATAAQHGTFVIESDDLVLDPAPFSKPIGGAR